MIKSETLNKNRKEEILNACEKLYETISFKDLKLQDIANMTSFTRTSIYNYYQTKEEIFLGLMEREYNIWYGELYSILNNNDKLTKEEFADLIAKSLEKRTLLLKLLSTNHYDMESNSRFERLVEFKKSYGNIINIIKELITKFFNYEEKKVLDIVFTFLPFMFGIYPYTNVSPMQLQAMNEAGTNYVVRSVYELTYSCLISLL